jgi:hypothetical protein
MTTGTESRTMTTEVVRSYLDVTRLAVAAFLAATGSRR